MVDEKSIPPTTTTQEDLVVAGQRRVNLIWEGTQSIISIFITAAVVYSSINKINSSDLTNAFFLIVGFYFSRTNHAAIGGIGPKVESVYKGR